VKWCAILCVCLHSAASVAVGQATCQVTLELTDAASGRQLAGVIRVKREGQADYLEIPGLQNRCMGLRGEQAKLGWRVLASKTLIELPAVDGLLLEAFSGLETKLRSTRLDLKGKSQAELELELVRIFSATEAGWIAGNTHLHLRDLTREQSDRYLREVSLGDGLSVVYVSYLERAIVDRTYITNAYSRQELVDDLSSEALKFGNGEEHRHNFGGGGEGFGHVMLLDLDELVRPVSIGPGITQAASDSLPLRRGIEAARAQDATVIWCHNGFGLEDLPNWIAGRVDAQNIFDGGNRGGFEDTFYRYLNVGMKVPFSAGTDWFVYDFSRVYVTLPKGEPVSAVRWLARLRAGRSFISNGPWLEFSVDGAGPGSELKSDQGEAIGKASGRHDFGRLQLVHNGEVIAETAARPGNGGGYYEADLKTRVDFAGPGWLALRIAPREGVTNELGQSLFAHTSPVYVSVEGRLRFDAQVARAMITEMREAMVTIDEQGTFATDGESTLVRAVYLEAIAIVEGWLAEGR